jgi:hypothetical protein
MKTLIVVVIALGLALVAQSPGQDVHKSKQEPYLKMQFKGRQVQVDIQGTLRVQKTGTGVLTRLELGRLISCGLVLNGENQRVLADQLNGKLVRVTGTLDQGKTVKRYYVKGTILKNPIVLVESLKAATRK